MAKKLTNNIDKVSKSVFEAAEGASDVPYLWSGMPEFVQEDSDPYACIEVEIRTKEDLAAFAAILEQPLINEKTKATWFPARDRFRNSSYRYFGTK